MPQAQLAVRDHLESAAHLRLINEARLPSEVSAEAHAGPHCVPMQHARGKLVAWAPGMAVGMRPALVRLPEIPVLGAHVALHRLPHDEITDVLERGVVDAIALRTELRLHALR